MKAPFSDSYIEKQRDIELRKYESGDIGGTQTEKKLEAIVIEDMLSKENGNAVAPDTIGVDFFFLLDFITTDMSRDFVLIEQDFLKNCRGKLDEFQQVGWYGEASFRTNKPLYAMENAVMRLIYNGAKIRDAYCLELIRYLYKVYHKKEYNQLKRFRTISPNEILSLAENDYMDEDYSAIGRVMGMCHFIDIKLHENCSVIYKLLNIRREKFLAEEDGGTEFEKIDEDLFNECTEQVDEWFKEQSKKPYKKQYAKYWETAGFVGKCLKNRGYAEDYHHLCIDGSMGLRMQMIRTLALLKLWKPRKEFTFEEIQNYTNIYDLVAALTDVADTFEYETGYLIGDEIDGIELEEALFNPANMSVKARSSKPEKKPATNVAPVSKGDASVDDYMAEIAELRKKLNAKEQENKYLREQYRSAKRSSEETEGLVKKYESERAELIALREYAYNSEHADEAVEEDKLPAMEEAIADRKIVIIGGHVNWQNKLKQMFPKWLFVHPDAYRTVNAGMLEDKEKVYFFTEYISHISYKKFVAIVREKNIPFGYIGSRNIDSVVAQIYHEMSR
jgi:hypothetical protein